MNDKDVHTTCDEQATGEDVVSVGSIVASQSELANKDFPFYTRHKAKLERYISLAKRRFIYAFIHCPSAYSELLTSLMFIGFGCVTAYRSIEDRAVGATQFIPPVPFLSYAAVFFLIGFLKLGALLFGSYRTRARVSLIGCGIWFAVLYMQFASNQYFFFTVLVLSLMALTSARSFWFMHRLARKTDCLAEEMEKDGG